MMVQLKVKDERLEEILEAAQTIIAETGIQSLSMGNVAARAKISRPTVYRYFASREHILGELVLNDMADLANQLDKLLGETEDPEHQLSLWVAHTLAYLLSPSHRVVKEVSTEMLPEEIRGLLRGMHGQFMLTLLSPLSRLSPEDSHSLAGFVYSAVVSAAKRIEEGGDFNIEAATLERFVKAGVVG